MAGGYDTNFVEKVPERFMCNICTKPLRDPYLVVCCGQHYCHSCLNSWFLKAPSCPHCRAEGEDFQHVINKSLKREILAQKVKCQHYQEGCDWTGELGSLNDHLESANGCGYVEVECTNQCTKIVTWVPQTANRITMKRKELAIHLQHNCSYRMYDCKYCSKRGKYEEITGKGSNYKLLSFHYMTCPEMPICCPNNCCTEKIKRKDIEYHRSQCPLESTECPNKCKKMIEGKLEKTMMLRKDLDSHLSTECYLRPYKCKYCSLKSTYEAITGKGVHKKPNISNHYNYVCQEFPLRCPNDCGESQIRRRDMEAHRKSCPEETVQCPHKCAQLAAGTRRKHLKKHVTEECPHRPHFCEHCGIRDTYTAITKHYNTCANYPIECSNKCGAKSIMRKNLTHHYDKCPLQSVDCPFAEAGCKTKLVRQDLENHNSTMQQHHLGLMMGAYKQLKQDHKKELQKTRDEVKRDRAELTHTKKELKQIRSELREAKSGLTQSKRELQQTKKELQDVKQSLSHYVKKRLS